MRICSNCGIVMENEALTFCPVCGKTLAENFLPEPEKASYWAERAARSYDTSTDFCTDNTACKNQTFDKEDVPDSYDGYYDDVLPIAPEEKPSGTLHRGTIIRIACIIAGAVLIAGFGVIAMYLL